MLEPKDNGILSLVYNDVLNVSQGDADMIDYEGQLIDEMSGKPTGNCSAQGGHGNIFLPQCV